MGRYRLEDGTGNYELEDGSGDYLLESFVAGEFDVWPAGQLEPPARAADANRALGWFTADPVDQPVVVTLDEFSELSVPALPRHNEAALQPASVSDPQELGAPEDTRISWFQALSEPVLPLHATAVWLDPFSTPQLQFDSAVLVTYARMEFPEQSEPAVVTGDEYAPLSEPTLPRDRAHEGWFTQDPATLDAVVRDEVQWFQSLSEPVLPTPQTRTGLVIVDPETLGAPETDRVQWAYPLSTPVLPRHLVREGGFAPQDPEALNDPFIDELDWEAPLAEPVLPRHQTRPGLSVIDPETLAEPLRDELQWFSPLAEPIRKPAPVQPDAGVWVEHVVIVPSADTSTEWFSPLSEPVLPRVPAPIAEWAQQDLETLGDPGVSAGNVLYKPTWRPRRRM